MRRSRIDLVLMLTLLPLVAVAGLPWWTSHWTSLFADAAALHVTACAAVVALAALVRRRRGLLIVAVLTAGAAAGRWVPSGLPAWPAAPRTADTDWVLLHANLGADPDLAALTRLVEDVRPHAVSLQEVRSTTPADAAGHNAAMTDYRRVTGEPRDDTRGVGLWVRKDVKSLQARITWLGRRDDGTDRPVASVVLQRDGVRLRLVGVHTKRPVGAAAAQTQRDELTALAENFPQDERVDVVWLGDFNAVPWSAPVRDTAKAAGLRPVRGAAFWTPTWLPRPPLAPAWAAIASHVGAPIDFALAPRPHEAQLAIGPDLGGDHLPLVLRIAAAPR